MNEGTLDIEAALTTVASQIASFEELYERSRGSVQLLAVSKKKPVSAIRAAIAAGQRAFGENYVDEGVEKIREIDNASLDWHFIGAIQSRKTALIAEHFHWAHGVDRMKVARRLAEQRPSHLPALNICLQVNLDSEPSKAGVPINEVSALAAECATLEGIKLRGLMAIPAPRDLLAEQRQTLAQLRRTLEDLQKEHPDMDTLSMGMSADMEAAIAEGATIVRVGTAIFGSRDT
ncbi:MAG: YggS family pyridoxal phosphate-dependent enzyme [Granulosicoccus sp.]